MERHMSADPGRTPQIVSHIPPDAAYLIDDVGRLKGRTPASLATMYSHLNFIGIVHREASLFAHHDGADTHFTPEALTAAAAATKAFLAAVITASRSRVASTAAASLTSAQPGSLSYRAATSRLTSPDILLTTSTLIPNLWEPAKTPA